MSAYLEALTFRLAAGLGAVDDEMRAEHARFFRGKQNADGGFADREGDSDLYYTSFALRSLVLLGALDDEPAQKAGAYLQQRLSGQTPIIDFLSLVYSAKLVEMAAGVDIFAAVRTDWRSGIAAAFEQLRRGDGGYAKAAEGTSSSTYHSFLVVLCLELIDKPIVEPQRLVEFVLSRQRDDGGFVEIGPMRRSGTNPTAAAVGLLKILDAIDEPVRQDVVEYLGEMQTDDEGGVRANTRIPIADLLSTFTGLLTLADLDALEAIDTRAALRYVHSMAQTGGGFRGAAWDEMADVEYSFYGLGSLAILVPQLAGDAS